MISRSGTQGATTGGTSVLGHTYGSLTFSTPRSRGAAKEGIRRKLLLLHFSKCWWWNILAVLRYKHSPNSGAARKGNGEGSDSREKKRGACPTYIGEGGSSPWGVQPAPSPFSPLHDGGNPLLHGKVTPSLSLKSYLIAWLSKQLNPT
jgi:hypothetical protein